MKTQQKGTVIRLTLTKKEARWLKGYIQNPQCLPEDESEEDTKMRAAFFNSLKLNLR